jgi:hypothetical protein
VRIASKIRYICIGAWLSLVVGGISFYLISPSSFTAENIAALLTEFHGPIWILIFAVGIAITLAARRLCLPARCFIRSSRFLYLRSH